MATLRWSVLWTLLPACSLLSLGDFDIPECEDNAQCAPLNERLGIEADACAAYYCRADRLCRFGPRDLDEDGRGDLACAGEAVCADGTCDDCDDQSPLAPGDEVCDGVDNDCNQIVDDVTATEPFVATESSFDSFTLPPGDLVGSLTFSTSEGPGALAFAAGRVSRLDGTDAPMLSVVTHDNPRQPAPTMQGCFAIRATAPPIPTAQPDVGKCQSHADCDDGVLCNGIDLCDTTAAPADQDENGCVVVPACTGTETCDEDRGACVAEVRQAGCEIIELSAAAFDDARDPAAYLVAGLEADDTDCVMRVGRLLLSGDGEAVTDATIEIRGDRVLSNTYRGVDLGAVGCEGRGPSVAALPSAPPDRRRPQGLAAWWSEGPMGASELRLLGVVEEETMGGAHWLHGTTAAPGTAATSTAVSGLERPRDVLFAPSVAALESPAGYLVAVATTAGARLVRVAALDDPAEVLAEPPFSTGIASGETAERTGLALPEPLVLEIDSAPALDVHVAPGPEEGDATIVGVLVARATDARFYRVRVTASGAELLDSVEVPAARPEDATRWTSLSYVDGGLTIPGFSQRGMTVDEDSDGGWVIAWRGSATTASGDPAGVLGLRISELNGEVLAPGTMALVQGEARFLNVAETRQAVRGSLIDRTAVAVQTVPFPLGASPALVAAPLFCGPALP